MAVRFKPKTPFGMEVDAFHAQTGVSIKALVQYAGVKYSTLIECTTGRSAGHELIPKVREAMRRYRKENNIMSA